jgi:signal transduction histidine kinase
LLATALALLLQGLIGQTFGNQAYLVVWAAVAFSALYCGLGPSLVAVVVAALGVWYFFLPPYHSLAAFANRADLYNTIFFIVLCDFIVIVAEANRRSQSARQRQAELLRRANEELARELADVRRLRYLSMHVLDDPDLSVRLDMVLKTCADVLGCEKGLIRLYDERTNVLTVAVQLGFTDAFLGEFGSVPASDSVYQAILGHRERLIIEDPWNNPRFPELRHVAQKHGFVAAQFTPLIGAEGRFLGTLSNHFARPHHPSERELRFVDLCAYNAVRAIERARLDQELEEAKIALENRVEERTRQLQEEIAERIQAEVRLRESEQALRDLSAHLLKTQDEERRRIGRELHDSVGQLLALLKLELDWLKSRVNFTVQGAAQRLFECADLVGTCIQQVRTVSYLLHPPLLEEFGLCSAIQWYLQGFSKRSGIETTFDAPASLGRLPSEVELAMFRVLQEALTNVHRHSGSATADVRLLVRDGSITMEVRDHGKGMGARGHARLDVVGSLSVGLQGMSERMRNIGGILEVEGTDQGTIIRASVPYSVATAARAISA